MACHTAEDASSLILDGSDDQLDSDGSGSEIDKNPEFPLPHSDSDDQDNEDSQQPDSKCDSDEDLKLPSSPLFCLAYHHISALARHQTKTVTGQF